MKLHKQLLLQLLIVALLFSVISSSSKHKRAASKSHTKTHHKASNAQLVDTYSTSARDYINFARLAYCKEDVIQRMSCSFCSNLTVNSYSTFFIHSLQKENNKVSQFAILYSDVKKEVIITFSGPSTEHSNYFNSINNNGFVNVAELGGIRIESEYWQVYSQGFRKLLSEKVHQLVSSNRAHYNFIFVGHSFGGSLATLASYDLVLNNIIRKTSTSPLVYTYGSLRIGDTDFVSRVNRALPVVKVMRNDDFVTRMNGCSFQNGVYRCNNAVASNFPVVRNYIRGYKAVYPRFMSRRDPIMRGTRYINGKLHQVSPVFTQPLGTAVYYNGANFSQHQRCAVVQGVPVCEKNVRVPDTFSPDVHKFYYNVNVESC